MPRGKPGRAFRAPLPNECLVDLLFLVAQQEIPKRIRIRGRVLYQSGQEIALSRVYPPKK